VQNKRRSKMGP